MITRYLFGTGVGAGDAIAYIDIPRAGRIVAIDWNISVDAEADTDTFALLLSFAAASQITTNDAQGIISTFRAYMNLVTSGMAFGQFTKFMSGISIPVKTNERIYLHAPLVTSVTYISQTVFHIA